MGMGNGVWGIERGNGNGGNGERKVSAIYNRAEPPVRMFLPPPLHFLRREASAEEAVQPGERRGCGDAVRPLMVVAHTDAVFHKHALRQLIELP